MVGLFFLFSQERVLCSVLQHFVLIDVEMGVHPAFVGTAKGRTEACFALGVKSGDICERPCCRGIFITVLHLPH